MENGVVRRIRVEQPGQPDGGVVMEMQPLQQRQPEEPGQATSV